MIRDVQRSEIIHQLLLVVGCLLGPLLGSGNVW